MESNMQHLERALDNQNQWWKYLVVFVSGFYLAGLVGSIPLIITVSNQTGGTVTADAMLHPTKYGVEPNLSLFLMLLPFVLGLITVSRLFRKLHRRSLVEVINGTQCFRWERFFRGLIVWGLLMLLCFLISYAFNPGNFRFSFQPAAFIPLLLISIALIPLQASFEEVMYRGYLAQGIAAWTGSRLLAFIVPALLFGLSHYANPEVGKYGFWAAMPLYLTTGFVLGIISILDDGIEVAVGAHAVNNIFGSVLISYDSAALQTPALFFQLRVDPFQELFVELLMSLVFIVLLGRRYSWSFPALFQNVRQGSFPKDPDPELRSVSDDPVPGGPN